LARNDEEIRKSVDDQRTARLIKDTAKRHGKDPNEDTRKLRRDQIRRLQEGQD
jgi:hypothetical protein